MINNQFSRTELLIGSDALKKLNNSRVCVFGLGGVGAYTVEALVQAGIGNIDICDNDTISKTNLNRQLLATWESIGIAKTEVCKNRILSINPNCNVSVHDIFYSAETADMFDFSKYDYIVDAIDTISSKIEMIVRATKLNIPVISSMGTGNKLNPSMFEVSDIYKTSVCPLAKVMRNELKKGGVKKLKVVYSKEYPKKPDMDNEEYTKELQESGKRQIPTSISFVPPVAGFILAGEIVCDLIKDEI